MRHCCPKVAFFATRVFSHNFARRHFSLLSCVSFLPMHVLCTVYMLITSRCKFARRYNDNPLRGDIMPPQIRHANPPLQPVNPPMPVQRLLRSHSLAKRKVVSKQILHILFYIFVRDSSGTIVKSVNSLESVLGELSERSNIPIVSSSRDGGGEPERGTGREWRKEAQETRDLSDGLREKFSNCQRTTTLETDKFSSGFRRLRYPPPHPRSPPSLLLLDSSG